VHPDCDPHPGNLACDAEEGGRLIYYDFGMMDELKPNVKKGLVDLLFGVYENDPREVCDALEEVGVLRKGVDRVSIEKLARAFLKEFARGIKPGEKWASDLSREQQRELARQRRQQLGADLFSIGNDVPFKFPPTFTFVFRAFTSLDGIGKGLDTRYDLTRLAQPYLKELIDLRDGSATVSVLNSWGKKLGLRPVDLGDAVQQPRKVANIERILTKMEQGDLKLRVRVLESERAFQRMNLVQNNMALGLAASTFLNIGVLLSVISNPTTQQVVLRKGMFALAALFGIQVPVGILRLNALDRKLASIS
jgi:predicted unusual protein kinase regulating ubiquinone biosynthesis (AarF/ABC1/UbiB family)